MVAEKGEIFKYLSQNIETFLEMVGEMKLSLVTLRRFYMWKEEIYIFKLIPNRKENYIHYLRIAQEEGCRDR